MKKKMIPPRRNDNARSVNAPMQTATLNAESHAILSKTVCGDHFQREQPDHKPLLSYNNSNAEFT